MSPFKKSILAVLAVWPLVYIIGFTVNTLIMVASPTPDAIATNALLANFALIFVLHLATIMMIMGQIVYYLWHIMTQNKQVTDNEKVVWVLCLFFFSMMTFIPYWFVYIRPDAEPLGAP